MDILIISSDKNYSNLIGKKISDFFPSTIAQADSIQDALQRLDKAAYQIVILCMPVLSLNCPKEALKLLQPKAGTARIIAIMDMISIHDAMQLVRDGMYTCLKRPFPMEELEKSIKNAALDLPSVKVQPAKNIKVETKNFTPDANYVKGVSEVTAQMYRQIELVGPTSFSVIIYGETGTGKESVAKQIADLRKPKGPYMTIDCGCLSKELALSEMFGHEKGSFTGAVEQKIGAFERANNGTLFLDEIGNLDYEVQGYLLRAIQERKIRRLGGNVDLPVAVRIIVASNENLADLVSKGKFREDLYHRLNEFKINVPPLRERVQDLPLFVAYFLKETNKQLNKNVLAPDALTMMMLEQYDWKGNIREFRNVIRRACLLAPDTTPISYFHLPEYLNGYNAKRHEEHSKELLKNDTAFNDKTLTVSMIMEALKAVNNNKTLAAQKLGVDRKTIYNKLKKIHQENEI